ncbi:MAG: hypothetical protein ACK559_40345, partial [bacterium]
MSRVIACSSRFGVFDEVNADVDDVNGGSFVVVFAWPGVLVRRTLAQPVAPRAHPRRGVEVDLQV